LALQTKNLFLGRYLTYMLSTDQMIRRTIVSLFFIAFLILSLPSAAQETEAEPVTPQRVEKGLPNIPGTFVLEFGFNQPFGEPDAFDFGFWGSRTFNLYYFYEMRIAKSKFSVHPGVGFSFERYKLNNDYTLANGADGTILVPAADNYPNVKKSMVVTNFIDVPIEFRFSTNPNDPGRSFHVAIGGRVGYLYDSFNKIKYRSDGDTKKLKDKQNFFLNDFRYGAFFKVGVGNFTIFSYYNFTPVFQEDKGPEQTDMKNFTIGISLSSF
jgi:hypothetical protein